MAIWIFRAGKSGEFENKFLNDGRVYLTWEDLNIDLANYSDRQKLYDYMLDLYVNSKKNTVRNWLGQVYPMANKIQKGDWVVLPSKQKSVIHIGEIKGDYKYDKKAKNPFYHYREVNWFAQDIPRSNFDQDILYSFGAFMTVCQIQRNNSEERIKKMSKNNWSTKTSDIISKRTELSDNEDELIENSLIDLEEFSKDQISKLIIRKFQGHRMEFLIESILKAKGYTTYHSPEGADKGVDILAAPSQMGFGNPKLCIQVKSTDTPIDRPTLDQLIGAIHNFGADHGLLVSWNGFKNSVEKERSTHFFKVRLWGQKEIIEEFLNNYDKLDDEIKVEIPLKKVWTLSIPENE